MLIPVLWIFSLSFKDPSTITDPTFFPTKWTWANYQRDLQHLGLHPAAAQLHRDRR